MTKTRNLNSSSNAAAPQPRSVTDILKRLFHLGATPTAENTSLLPAPAELSSEEISNVLDQFFLGTNPSPESEKIPSANEGHNSSDGPITRSKLTLS